jgi:hypothetical protein
MTLTQQEYDVARGLVAQRPNTLSEAGVASKAELPWDTPNQSPGLEVPLKAAGIGDLETWARTSSNSDLIQFLTTPSDYLRRYSFTFGNRYVCAWLGLQHRVRVFGTEVDKSREIADEDKKIAEDGPFALRGVRE